MPGYEHNYAQMGALPSIRISKRKMHARAPAAPSGQPERGSASPSLMSGHVVIIRSQGWSGWRRGEEVIAGV